MKAQLTQYVDLLFAGARGCEDIRQEILQNTLDRYDDLIAEGKTPEAAYRLAIMGIGDISEILGAPRAAAPASAPAVKTEEDTPGKKLMRAIAVALYILCPIPLLVLGSMPGLEVFGLCGLLAIVAVATILIMLGGKKEEQEAPSSPAALSSDLSRSIRQLVWAVGLVLYFCVSFATQAWYITWVIFPLTGAVNGLIRAIIDLKEAVNHEN